jgi:formylmethanofuran dehydrogenase subunit B
MAVMIVYDEIETLPLQIAAIKRVVPVVQILNVWNVTTMKHNNIVPYILLAGQFTTYVAV